MYIYMCVCRLGNDQGRSVSAWGFWGDILNSPYHSFGTACDERSLFKISNKQHTHTAIDVAEYNVKVQHDYQAADRVCHHFFLLPLMFLIWEKVEW